MLGQLYRTTYVFCVSHQADNKPWTSEGLTPQEVRTQSNKQELHMVLFRLGQNQLVTSIEREVEASLVK